ncbi:membrane dipeptidase [uncultured Pontibacter sp.]|uniref:dipeptidase n=1 Tax=uncultured Pontibacter sp. TaxID=453356 RepID=UPI002626508F|nr:membrane dipeptidase [uncultured Pontibacter sp.]
MSTQATSQPYPIIDLHCDLLVYLTDVPNATLDNIAEIGCALPALTAGNVKLQVMAIYCATAPGSTNYAALQRDMFAQLANDNNCGLHAVTTPAQLQQALHNPNGIGMVAAVENASGFCEEDEPLEDGFKKLEKIIDACGRILYISMTHNDANRFGGGNFSDKGITRDGQMLLDYIHGRQIAIDLSHTSDALAYDILTHIDNERLDVPVIASHSNFRAMWDQRRNLPNELAQEVIRRNGLIGMNFLRSFLNTQDPEALIHHMLHGLNMGAQNALCFGADYFYFADHPDPARFPFYYSEHEHAGTSYNFILEKLKHTLPQQQLEKIAYGNAQQFIERIWQIR